MDSIYYLIHGTNNPDCLNWSHITVSDFNTNHQFPGAYFSVITNKNILTEPIYARKYIFIFSKQLLLQQNYHLNVIDHNGIISEHNTYYPWNIDEFVNQLSSSKSPYNECVFHDDISMEYCCAIINLVKRPLRVKVNLFLPPIPMQNDKLPDMTKSPFYCYPFEDIYTGFDKLKKSSRKWFKMMTGLCNVDTKAKTRKQLLVTLKNKSADLYTARNKQNISLLKNYTLSKRSNKSKTSRRNTN